jgi:hypothetical protein
MEVVGQDSPDDELLYDAAAVLAMMTKLGLHHGHLNLPNLTGYSISKKFCSR